VNSAVMHEKRKGGGEKEEVALSKPRPKETALPGAMFMLSPKGGRGKKKGRGKGRKVSRGGRTDGLKRGRGVFVYLESGAKKKDNGGWMNRKPTSQDH